MITHPDIQYFTFIEKGMTVTYGNRMYTVQEDRGHLHIVVRENGIRKKISIESLRKNAWQYGTYADWIFNGWSMLYTWAEYESFTKHELLCITSS